MFGTAFEILSGGRHACNDERMRLTRDWWTPGARTLALQLAAYTDTEMCTVGCSDEVKQTKTSRASVRKVCFGTCENAAHGS